MKQREDQEYYGVTVEQECQFAGDCMYQDNFSLEAAPVITSGLPVSRPMNLAQSGISECPIVTTGVGPIQ